MGEDATGPDKGRVTDADAARSATRPAGLAEIASTDQDFEVVLIVRMLRDNTGQVVDGLIEFTNDAWRRTFGLSDADLAGRRLLESVPAFSERITQYGHVVDTGETFRGEVPLPGDPARRFSVQFTPDGDRLIVVGHEVTREGALEAALVESEHRYRTIAQNAADVVFRSSGGITTWVSPSVAEVLGWTPDELIGTDTNHLWHPEDRAFARHIREAAYGGTIMHERARIRRRDDRYVWMQADIRPYTDETGTAGAIGTLRDVSDQVEAQGALAETRTLLQGIVDSTAELMWSVDADDFRLTWCNRTFADYFRRYREIDVEPGLSVEDLVPNAEIATLFRGLYAQALRAGSAEVEYATITAPVTLELRFKALVREGRAYGVAAFGRDVTEQRSAERELAHREAELAEAQRIAHVGSFTLDSATGDVTWSPEMYRIVGLDPSSPAPATAERYRFYTDGTRQPLIDAAVRCLATGEPYEVNVDVLRDDGVVRKGIARGEAARDTAGTITGLRGTMFDLTELRQAEDRLAQAQGAELIGRIAGDIAHDFNNVLTLIVGSADFLAASLPEDDRRRDDVASIIAASERAAALTRQLLSLGRREPLAPAVFDVDAVVAQLRPMLRSLLPAGVELVVEVCDSGCRVRVDRSRLEQALVNLVINARDAMPEGGRVTVRIDARSLAAGDPDLVPPAPAGTYVSLVVEDTGIGMTPETIAHIFEPFYSTKVAAHGSGLGLTSVEAFATQSGGFVSVRSAVGVGSTFAIRLPLAEAPSRA